MQYKIVTGYNEHDIASKVKDLINRGWLPQGGVSVMNNSYKETWAQAMVKVDA